MTHLIALMTLIPCVAIFAEDPKPLTTELEGIWREPSMPGEDPAVRYKIVFTGDKITFAIGSRVLTGTFIVIPMPNESDRGNLIYCRLRDSQGTASSTVGIYRIEKNELSLSLDPETTPPLELGEHDYGKKIRKIMVDIQYMRDKHPDVEFALALGRAPLALTLGKIKK